MVVEVFDAADASLSGYFFGVGFVFGQLLINLFGYLRKRSAGVAGPEKVAGIEVVAFRL